jgi:hypothetical protein
MTEVPYDEATAVSNARAEVLRLLQDAARLRAAGAHAQAWDAVTKAKRAAEDATQLVWIAGALVQDHGTRDEAVRCLHEAELRAEDFWDWIRLAGTWRDLPGHAADVARCLDRAESAASSVPQLLRAARDRRDLLGDVERAREVLLLAETRSSTRPDWLHLADAWRDVAGDPARATAALDRADVLRPPGASRPLADVLLDLAVLLLDAGDATRWSETFEALADTARADERDAAARVRSLYWFGIGGVTDLYLCAENGHRSDDFDRDNARLQALTAELAEVAGVTRG